MWTIHDKLKNNFWAYMKNSNRTERFIINPSDDVNFKNWTEGDEIEFEITNKGSSYPYKIYNKKTDNSISATVWNGQFN